MATAADQPWPAGLADQRIWVFGAVPSTQTRWTVPLASTPMTGFKDETVGVFETFVNGLQDWPSGSALVRGATPPRTRQRSAMSRTRSNRCRINPSSQEIRH